MWKSFRNAKGGKAKITICVHAFCPSSPPPNHKSTNMRDSSLTYPWVRTTWKTPLVIVRKSLGNYSFTIRIFSLLKSIFNENGLKFSNQPINIRVLFFLWKVTHKIQKKGNIFICVVWMNNQIVWCQEPQKNIYTSKKY